MMHRLGLALAALLFVACGGGTSDLDASAADASVPMDAQALACTTDPECDDGVFCNGVETCSSGHCVARTLACDDGIGCTIDTCNETTRSCVSHPPDRDGDGFDDARCFDAHGVPLGTDCDDDDPTAFPGNPEICNDHDEDCDPTTLGGGDSDHDGAVPDTCCNPAPGGAVCGRDCDDGNPSISQLATEICDTIDNDCDHAIDEDATSLSYPDEDHDGWGDATATPEIVCVVPSSRANQGMDCDDADIRIHPGATDDCNAVDDDCDGTVDEHASEVCLAGHPTTIGACIAGECVVTGCSAPSFDCDGDATNGCEAQDFCTSQHACGHCGLDCGFANCQMGVCDGAMAAFAPTGATVRDATTSAPIANALVESIAYCPALSMRTAADGSYITPPPHSFGFPEFVRITAPGYPPHVERFGVNVSLIPQRLVDAWSVDPDASSTPDAAHAIIVADIPPTVTRPPIVDGDPGPFDTAGGTAIPAAGAIPYAYVYLHARPGRVTAAGVIHDGPCIWACGAETSYWLEAGAVTHFSATPCVHACP